MSQLHRPGRVNPARAPERATLAGRTIAVLQARRARELAGLIERYGGVPYVTPSLREVPVDDPAEIRDCLDRLASQPIDLAIFQTGVGAARLIEEAAQLGRGALLADRLAGAIVVARGPKPLAVLGSAGIRVDRRTVEPHTTTEVLDLLEEADLVGRTVLVQHYGAPNPRLTEFLTDRGAQVLGVTTYQWALPEDTEPLVRLIGALIEGSIDAVAFTSAAQVSNLFAVAEQLGCAAQLTDQLRERALVAAIGPVCAEALSDRGISVRVQPDRPKMVPLVQALAGYYSPAEQAPGERGSASR